MTVERFSTDAEERLTLARAMMESVDPLDFIEGWVAPEERHRSKFIQTVSVAGIAGGWARDDVPSLLRDHAR